LRKLLTQNVQHFKLTDDTELVRNICVVHFMSLLLLTDAKNKIRKDMQRSVQKRNTNIKDVKSKF